MARPSAYSLRDHIISRFNRVCNVKEGVEASQLTIAVYYDWHRAKYELESLISELEHRGVDFITKKHQLTVNFTFKGKEKTVVFASKSNIEPLYGYPRGSSIFIFDSYL